MAWGDIFSLERHGDEPTFAYRQECRRCVGDHTSGGVFFSILTFFVVWQ